MGMHRDLRMQKFLQATISSTEFMSIPTNTKFTKAVRYIHDNKSWGRCYILLNILFTCLRVLRLADSNLVGMGKFYYYSIMTKQCIQKTISGIYRSWGDVKTIKSGKISALGSDISDKHIIV